MTHQAKPESFVDDEGKLILVLPIRNRPGRVAKIEAADYAHLSAGRRSLSLFMNGDGKGNEYLMVGDYYGDAGPTTATVARILMQPSTKHVVRYRNGDKADVRRSNLVLSERSPGRRCRIAKGGLIPAKAAPAHHHQALRSPHVQ